MRTRDLMATMWIGLVIVAVTLGLVSAGVMLDNRQLRAESRQLRAELDVLGGESAVWRSERQLLEEELDAQRKRVETLSAQLAEMKSTVESKGTAVAQTAYRVRAYLDNQTVGQGWLLPGRATTNANGGLVYEPLVVLDPSTRAALTRSDDDARQSESEVPTVVTVNNNYPNYPYPSNYGYTSPAYWIWTVGHKDKGHHRPGGKSNGTTQPQPPATPPTSPFLNTRIWQPQTGFQQMPRGRPGGDWISSSPRGHSYISSGASRAVTGTSGGPFPARY